MKKPSLFEKLAAQEKEFFSSEFLSPVIKGVPVRVRISGIEMTFKVTPKNFQGWGIFKTFDQGTAKHMREPTMQEKQKYLELYPKFSFVVSRRGNRTFGVLANASDDRVQIQGQVPILLTEEVQLFDTIDARFDGSNFWFEGLTAHRSPRFATQFRDKLAEEAEPEKFEIVGATAEERLVYFLAYAYEIDAKKDRKEEKIKEALNRGGAIFRSYVERGNTYTVEFTVNGERHRSVIDSETLQVSSAGICLTDHRTNRAGDTDFDLQSLVGVIKEGQNRRLIHRW